MPYYDRKKEPVIKFDRTFRRMVVHSLKYALLIIPATFGAIWGLVTGIIYLFSTYGPLVAFAIIGATLLFSFLAWISIAMGRDYVVELERKEERAMELLRRENNY